MVANRTMIAAARHHGEGAADILFQTLILCCALQQQESWDCTLAAACSSRRLSMKLLWRKGQPIPERPPYVAFAPGTPPPEKVHSFVDQLADCASILRSDIL
jgi:hypothetical protein